MPERIVTGQTATFRTLGNAATVHHLLTAEVAASSELLFELHEVLVWLDATAVLTAVMPVIRLARTTALPTGGAGLTPVMDDGAESIPAGVTFRGATASDGGSASTVTATQAAPYAQTYAMRLHTLVGQVRGAPAVLYRKQKEMRGLVLWPGSGVSVTVVSAVGTSNPATNHWLVQARWGVRR